MKLSIFKSWIKIKIFCLTCFAPWSLVSVCAQNVDSNYNHGIAFRNNMGWNEILSYAKVNNKFIFLDCYATWCGPCKYMADSIFILPEVGNFMNNKFISASVQLDRTPKDNSDRKRWYRDAEIIQKEYSVYSFPTFLIFSPNGNLLQKIEGATGNKPTDFISKIQLAFDSTKPFYKNEKEELATIRQHKSDSAFLYPALNAALEKRDYTRASFILSFYFPLMKNPYERDNLSAVEKVIHFSYCDQAFNFVLDNHDTIKRIDGNNWIDQLIIIRLIEDQVRPLAQDGSRKPNWKHILRKLNGEFPSDFTGMSVAEEKADYYYERSQFAQFGKAMVEYMSAYRKDLAAYFVNGNAWQIFTHCSSRKVLKKASIWIKEVMDKQEFEGNIDPNIIDTYANLLYKAGQVKKGKLWESRALQYAKRVHNDSQIKSITKILSTMEAGENTWN